MMQVLLTCNLYFTCECDAIVKILMMFQSFHHFFQLTTAFLGVASPCQRHLIDGVVQLMRWCVVITHYMLLSHGGVIKQKKKQKHSVKRKVSDELFIPIRTTCQFAMSILHKSLTLHAVYHLPSRMLSGRQQVILNLSSALI